MLDRTDDIAASVENWLTEFERALEHPEDGVLRPLFHPESYWRDALALSWNLQTINGADAIQGNSRIMPAKPHRQVSRSIPSAHRRAV